MNYKSISPLYVACLCLLAGLAAVGCKKYDVIQPVAPATYLRVFNCNNNYDINNSDLSVSGAFTLLIDPVTGPQAIPSSAAITGDFLYFRPFYAAAYETRPNLQYLNLEYPGSYPVPVGGVMNGLDLSRWARIPAGTHRIMMMRRRGTQGYREPFYFENSTAAGRDTTFLVVMDTTLNLSENEAYTLEIYNKDPYDTKKLQWYVRKESFLHQQFDTSKVYVNFYNMMTAPSTPDALDVYVHMRYVQNCIGPLVTRDRGFSAQEVTYSFAPGGLPQQGYISYDTPDTLLTKISTRFATEAPYVALPMPALDSFYYQTGPAIGQYRLPLDRPKYVFEFYRAGQSPATGAKPYTEMVADEFNVEALSNSSELIEPTFFFLTAASPPDPYAPFISSLYQTVTRNKVTRSFPLVTTIEMMNAYKGLNTPYAAVKAFQISLQRPYDPSFIQ